MGLGFGESNRYPSQGNIVAKLPGSGKNVRPASMAMLTDRNSTWTTEITEDWVSPAYGAKQIAPVVRISGDVKLPANCGFRLLPTTRTDDLGTFAAIGEEPSTPRVAIVTKYVRARSSSFSRQEIAFENVASGSVMPPCSFANWRVAGWSTLLWCQALLRSGAGSASYIRHMARSLSG